MRHVKANCLRQLLALLGLDEVFCDSPDEILGAWRYSHFTLEDGFKVLWRSVKQLGVFLVLAHAGSIEIDPGEDAFIARIAQQLGVHPPVGCSLAGAPDGS